MTMHSFMDLTSWQRSHQLVIDIYRATENFPAKEQFGLTNQIRRAAVSIASNLAEGFGRRSVADKSHFYDMARASLHEVQAQLLIARDVGYLVQESYATIKDLSEECHKLITGLLNKTKTFE